MRRRSTRRVSLSLLAAALLAASCVGDDGDDDVVATDATASTDGTETETDSTDAGPDSTDDNEADSATDTDSTDAATDSTDDTDTDTDTGVDGVGDASTIDWRPCDDVGIANGPLVECATLDVPLDHADPDGEMIELALARIDTAPDADQIGHVVFNPGGPGGSGLEFLEQASFVIPVEVQDRFDLVSFDPRGVGASTALDCAIEIDDNVPLLEEGDDAGWDALVDESLAALDDCTPDTIDLGPWVGTNNAARDLDALREALGDDGLTYVGYSYGTRLGATYAELFPTNVRALVLDAGMRPTDSVAELNLGQAAGFDRALTNFASACDSDQDCILQELGPTLDVIESLRAELDELGEIPAGDDRVLTRGELDLGIIAALYSKDAWPFLAQALYVAETEQDGELLQVLGDNLQGRKLDGTYDNSNVANGFIICADDPNRPPEDEVRASVNEAAALSQFFDDGLRASTNCLGLPESIDPLAIGPAAGASPILVIGSSGDPATPYEWSVELAESLDSGVLFTVEAEGHTAYGSIDCVAEPVNAYLIDLEVPSDPTCSDNASADFFVPPEDNELFIIVELFDCMRDDGADIPDIGIADILADPTGEELAQYLDPSDPSIGAALLSCPEEIEALRNTL